MKNFMITISAILNIAIIAIFVLFGNQFIPYKGFNKAGSVVSNIILPDGQLLIGGSEGYAEPSTLITFDDEINFATGIVQDHESITATTTLTNASGNVVFLPASANMTTITLPAVEAGLRYEFIVTGALTGATTTIVSAEGDNIEGILMVNDADVACSGEDQLTFITDGEVVGDRVEIMSDGTSWYIMDSDIDAASKMTCTDPS